MPSTKCMNSSPDLLRDSLIPFPSRQENRYQFELLANSSKGTSKMEDENNISTFFPLYFDKLTGSRMGYIYKSETKQQSVL